MYKVVWDKENNGILLVDSSSKAIKSPQPVFYEELDLLGLDKFWKYPKVYEPLLWKVGRRYYYKGRLVAEVKGGGIYGSPTVIIKEGDLSLEPVDVRLLVEKNAEPLRVLENEAINFITDTFQKYKDKVDKVVVSYSGGKDSQVILELVSKALLPDDYIVIFTDTTMEIPTTYEMYDKTKQHYISKYPNLKFYTARSDKHSLELWKVFGAPSRIHRWCCTVYKTAPQIKLIRNLYPGKDNIRILVFDGVRAEESPKRNRYERIGSNVKHIGQTNAEIIKYWNLSEVFLYLFKIDIENGGKDSLINKGYRYGLKRVGCSICPFGSDWSECVISQAFPQLTSNYLEIIREYAKARGIMDETEIDTYIIQGSWKKRFGGRGIDKQGTSLDISEEDGDFTATVTKPREKFSEWIQTLGNVMQIEDGNYRIYNVTFQNVAYTVKTISSDDKLIVSVAGGKPTKTFINALKKVIYKTTYCVHCGACEVECHSGALKVTPQVSIDSDKCLHCLSCLNFCPKGCLLAKSVDGWDEKSKK